jgi:hypothetical protein
MRLTAEKRRAVMVVYRRSEFPPPIDPTRPRSAAPARCKTQGKPGERTPAPRPTLLADNGYFSEANVIVCVAANVEPLIAAGRQPHHASWRERFAAAPPAPENPTPVETMAWRLRTPQGKKRYGLRKQTPEPVFGIIKAVMGFRQFLLRGFDCVVMAWNIKRMYALRLGPPAPRFNHVAVPEHRPPPPTLNRVR